MMKKLPRYPRILGIAPSTRGFGFAVLEGLDVLVDWGVKTIKGDKNDGSIARVEELLALYQPDVAVLENTLVKPFHRSARIRALTKRIVSWTKRQNISVLLFGRKEVKKIFFADVPGTKHALAGIIANTFPDELGFRLPPKRKPWMSEDSRMAIFDAVALALMVRRKR